MLFSKRVFKPLLLPLLIAVVFKAQSQHEIKITPPAPEATSVFKFQEVPVSTYTGLANTTVPLYTINLKRMSIPINVSYHARGVKVDEIASRVGIGWALNYGGMISRQIRGKADDSGLGYLYSDYYNEVFTDINQQSSMMDDIINGNLDEYPDLFFFDMVGQGGKFTFDQISQNIVQQRFSDNKITPIFATEGPQIEGWVITDAEGNTFYYGFSEDRTRQAIDYDQVSESYVFKRNSGNVLITPSNEERAITSWHLMEIKTALGERVQFMYESPSEEEICISYRHSHDQRPSPDTQTDTHVSDDVYSFFSKTYSHQPQLQEIVFDNGKVTFVKSLNVRDDLEGSHTLDLVQIFDGGSSLLKEYAFQYYYTTSPNNNNQLAYLKAADPKSSKRLFLQSIQERGQSGKTIPPYFFEYNPIVLPNRFSTSQDNWGYYNGKDNGEYLTFFNYGSININREVDILMSEAGILKKIKYPTGGYVLFDYEHNIAIPPNFVKDLLIAETNPSPTDHRLEGFLKHPRYLNETGSYVDTFRVGEVVGTAKFSIDVFNGFYSEDEEVDCHCRVILHGNGQSLWLYPPQETHVLSLSAGEYVFEVVPLLPNGDPFYIKLEWDEYPIEDPEEDPAEPEPMYAAGKRIKRITYVNSNQSILSKEYRYIKPSGITSGRIFGLPNFYSIQRTVGDIPLTHKYGCMPGSPLTALQGNSVGYSHVTEYTLDANNKSIGRTEYEFTVTEDGGQYFKFPFHLPIDNEWLRGKNIITSIFENDDLKKVTENEYLYANKILPADFLFKPADVYKYSISNTISYLPLLVFTGVNPAPGTGYAFTTYYVMGGTCDLNSIKESYYENGRPTFFQIKKYYYNYNHHYQLQGTESISSDGAHTFTYTTYANDYASGTAFIDAMKAKNLLAYPIEQITYKDNAGAKSIVSGNLTYYKPSIPALPDSIHVLELSNPIPLSGFKFSNGITGELPLNTGLSAFSSDTHYKSQVHFNSYDSKGNVLQMTSNGRRVTSYLWDYSNTLAVARVNGAQQNDIAYASFEAEAKGNWSFNGVRSSDDTSPAGIKIYNLTGGTLTKSGLSQSKKYILTYWVKSSSPVTTVGSTGSSISEHVIMNNVNGWSQFRCEVSNTTQLTLSGAVSIDEVRLHPAGAEMTTFCYNPLNGMTSSADSNGVITYYTYDLLNRFQAVKDQKGNILKFFQYHYSQQP